uniref:Uncharacterized protein n=1 Tax=Megaselia scalaris TaxID=36166 RepID=T1GGM5_MEGSC
MHKSNFALVRNYVTPRYFNYVEDPISF